MTARSARGRWLLFGSAILLVAIGVVLVARLREDHLPSETYCLSFGRPAREVAQVRASIQAGTEDDARIISGLVYSDGVASGSPREVRHEAETVAHGLRRALASGSTDPLDTPAFRSAVKALDARSATDCPPPKRAGS